MDILDKIEEPQTGKSVDQVLADGYEFNFGDYLGQGFSLFGKEAGNLIGFSLTYFAISLIASYLFNSIGIPFIDSLFSLLVGSALSAGIYAFMKARNADFGASFNAFFDGFKSPTWGRLILALIIQSILSFVVIIIALLPYFLNNSFEILESLSNISRTQDPDEILALLEIFTSGELFLYILLALLLGLAITTLWILTPLFILNRDMGFWQAMEASRKIVSRKFFHFFGLLFVLALLMAFGALLCGLGLLVAYPVFCLSIFAAYSHIMQEPVRM